MYNALSTNMSILPQLSYNPLPLLEIFALPHQDWQPYCPLTHTFILIGIISIHTGLKNRQFRHFLNTLSVE